MSHLKFLSIARLILEGYHCWPEAPEPVAFLRTRHRHLFHLEVACEVNHADRDIEFITLRSVVEEEMRVWRGEFEARSCEMIGEWLFYRLQELKFHPKYIRVFEDGENGAEVYAA